MRTVLGVSAGVVAAVGLSLALQALLPWGDLDGSAAPVPGDRARFDPVAVIDEVANFACTGCVLVSLRASGVRADGTVDLTQGGRVEYEFRKPSNEALSGGSGIADYIGVKLERPRGWQATGYARGLWMTKQGSRRLHEPSAPPAPRPCQLARLWERSGLGTDAASGPAQVMWDRRGATLQVRGAGHAYAFSNRCELRAELPAPPG